ncbi:DUF1405 domain-containing protein [Natronomonas sp.]|uniref:DUF1405 domain-containing protein n=1 Tax=Natronomonas sp. TaxID=2184060 RepID=UPI00260E3BD9|nr:DUF1405 domain-containing protein [Natronomonas sp.]
MDVDGLFESDVPRGSLPRYVAPLPESLENLALNLVWPIVAINLLGTAFGFYYYGWQLSATPVEMWVFVPDSPVATLFIALALASWKLGRPQQWLIALAFFGNVVLGGWTVWVHLAFYEQFGYLGEPMRQFLIWSHAAMVLQAFVLHRIGSFRPGAVGVATLWYGVDTVVDYFVPIRGDLHHTVLPTARDEPAFLGADALGVAAAGAVALLVASVYLSLLTRIELRENAHSGAS